MSFWLAWQFLTVLPAPRQAGAGPAALGRSLVSFPIVGLLLGGILAGLGMLMDLALPSLVTAVALVAVLAVLTGAHHLDGLIDTCDGMVAGKSRDERLKLMSASGVGAFGIVGACLVLLLKSAAIYSSLDWATLLLMPVLSRWTAVGAIFFFPYARTEGLGLAYKMGVRWHHVASATAIALLAAVLLKSWAGAAIMAAVGLAMLGVASYLKSRLGGLTGDTYGAMIESSEVLAPLFLVTYERMAG